MTAKAKSKVKEFELNEEFEQKYSDITKIYTISKVLILEHYTGALIQSKYYDDDSIKTIKELREALIKKQAISVDFDIEGFLGAFAQLLARSILQEAQQEETQVREEQQQKNSLQEEIELLREQHQNITPEDWTLTLQEKYQNLYNVVQNEMSEIWPGLEFELSVFRVLNIGGCTLPFIGIILGRPSSYKTVIIELLKKWHNTFYTDNFTARILLTPELSPMFTTKEEDLTQLLGIITRIADGHGYSSDSGAHGHRGYDEEIMFTWIGAAVDIPYKVYKILNNLGHRLYFFRIQFPEETSDQLLEYAATGEDFNNKKLKVQTALFDYLKWFEIGPNLEPDKKMKWDHTQDDRAALKIIVGMADLLSFLRCIAQVWETKYSEGSDYAYSISQREVPRRAVTALSNLARGHALLAGRNYITMDDVPLVIKTAMDSAQIERVSMFNLLLAYGGKLTTTQILQSLNVARKTALRTMVEFKAIGLVDLEDFHEEGQNNLSKRIVINSRFNWLLEDSVITKVFPHTQPFFLQPGGGDGQSDNNNTSDIEDIERANAEARAKYDAARKNIFTARKK